MNAAPEAERPPVRGGGRVPLATAIEAAGRLKAAGRWKEAAAAYQVMLRHLPDAAEAWDGLGSVAHHTGRHAESERLFRRAVELAPGNPNFREHLGVALRALKRPKEAIDHYEAALALDPHRASTLNNLGNALAENEEHERAVAFLRQAVSLEPNSGSFRLNLVRALMCCRRSDEALVEIEPLRNGPLATEAGVVRGHVLMQQGRWEEAIESYRRAAAGGAREHQMYHNLGTALQYFGRSEEAAAAYRTALAIQPDFAPTRRQLTGVRKHQSRDRDVEELEKLAIAPNLSVTERADVHMGLAKIYDDLNEYRKAFFHLQAGNQLIRSTIDYSATFNTDFVEAAIDTFDEKFFAERRGFGFDSEVPVFILGMPRSGTSLVEQILASHPHVHGAGELKRLYELFARLRQRLKPDLGLPRIARLIDRPASDDMGREFLSYLTAFNPEARFITDKMPFNYRILGLIGLLYPKARVIHCRRHPIDVGLSCYMARFHDELSFAFNLVDIGRYYRDYERLMTHWRQVVHNPMFEIEYEQLTAEPESTARRMLEFCGLEWDERCLRFYETERPVTTASNWQVRQPVYTSSVGRWQNYKEYLEPLIAALGKIGEECR